MKKDLPLIIVTALILGVPVLCTATYNLIQMFKEKECPYDACPTCGNGFIMRYEAWGPNKGRHSIGCSRCGWEWK